MKEFFRNLYRVGNYKHDCPCESVREITRFTENLLEKTRPNLSPAEKKATVERLIFEAQKELRKDNFRRSRSLRLPKTPNGTPTRSSTTNSFVNEMKEELKGIQARIDNLKEKCRFRTKKKVQIQEDNDYYLQKSVSEIKIFTMDLIKEKNPGVGKVKLANMADKCILKALEEMEEENNGRDSEIDLRVSKLIKNVDDVKQELQDMEVRIEQLRKTRVSYEI